MPISVLKKLGAATAVLVVAWILYLYHQVPHEQAPFAKAGEHAERIVLERGSLSVELRKESGRWKAGSANAAFFTADEATVSTLLSGLKNLQVDDQISDRADRMAEYEINAGSGTVVKLADAKGSTLAAGVFGKQAPDMSHIYFRYADQPGVYLARGVYRGDLGRMDVNFWRSRQAIEIPETKIQKILIEGRGFKTELVRVSTDAWTLNGKPVEPGPVNALVGTLAHLHVDDFVDSAALPGLTEAGLTHARLAVQGEGSFVELRIGSFDAKSKRFPGSLGPNQGLVWLSESSVKAILQPPSAFKEKK